MFAGRQRFFVVVIEYVFSVSIFIELMVQNDRRWNRREENGIIRMGEKRDRVAFVVLRRIDHRHPNAMNGTLDESIRPIFDRITEIHYDHIVERLNGIPDIVRSIENFETRFLIVLKEKRQRSVV